MITALLLGSRTDRRLHSFLEKALRNRLGLLSLTAKGCTTVPNPRLLLWDCGHASRVEAQNAIVIIKQKHGVLTPITYLPEHPPVVVLPSQSSQAAEFAARSALPAITCGLGSKDTLTLTSLGEGNAVVALQRAVTAYDGNVIQPMELPVKLSSPQDSYSLLALAALLAFSGELGEMESLEL